MNLLPPALRRRARAHLTATALRAVAGTLLWYCALAAIVLLVGQALVEWNYARVIERSTLVLRVDRATAREVQETNELLRMLEEHRRAFSPWTIVLADLADRVPADIILTTLAIEDDATLRVEGRAATRDGLLAFETRLRGAPYIADVTIPFTSLLRRERVDFSLDAHLNRATIPLPEPSPPSRL